MQQVPNAQIVDISHEIESYNIVQAAFLFKHAWSAFPQGSIHILSVNDFADAEQGFLAFEQDGHYFIGPNNGLFSLVFDLPPAQCFQIEMDQQLDTRFPLAAIYGHAASHLAQDFPPGGLGTAVDHWTERLSLQPVIGPSHIRGSVVYIDHFDNVVLNISQDLFEEVGRGRPFELFFKRHNPITVLCHHYRDVPVGETLCRFNSAYVLEIAINMGKAASLLGLKEEDTVQIDFSSSK